MYYVVIFDYARMMGTYEEIAVKVVKSIFDSSPTPCTVCDDRRVSYLRITHIRSVYTHIYPSYYIYILHTLHAA